MFTRVPALVLLPVALALFAGGTVAADAQLTLPSAPPTTSPVGIVQVGQYLEAPIALDGNVLFHIAAPVIASPNQPSLTQRMDDVEAVLGQLLATTGSGRTTKTIYDPKSIRVRTASATDAVVLEAVDDTHATPLPIVTVTTTDAAANATTLTALAQTWESALQDALEDSLEARQPAVERSNFRIVARVLALMIGASVAVYLTVISIWRRMEALQNDVTSRTQNVEDQRSQVSAADDDASVERRKFFAVAMQNVEPAQRLSLYRAIAETLVWTLALAWLIAIIWGFSLFPQTSPLAKQIFNSTFAVATTIVATLLLNRLLDIGINRAASVWKLRTFTTSEERARLVLRIPTIARALSGFKSFALVFIALLSILGAIGVPIGSVVTIGGLAAVALSLAAQNFVRDFINGLLVLLEDQYVVGDYVTINSYSGLVERLTLRMVQIRDAKGEVITIPHSSVTNVVNQSRNWSRVDFSVPVDPAADVTKALELVRGAIETLAHEDAWRESVLDPVEWIGIDAMSRDWIIVRASVRTAPLRQFELRRQINARVHAALGDAGIGLGAQIPGIP